MRNGARTLRGRSHSQRARRRLDVGRKQPTGVVRNLSPLENQPREQRPVVTGSSGLAAVCWALDLDNTRTEPLSLVHGTQSVLRQKQLDPSGGLVYLYRGAAKTRRRGGAGARRPAVWRDKTSAGAAALGRYPRLAAGPPGRHAATVHGVHQEVGADLSRSGWRLQPTVRAGAPDRPA